MHFLEKINTLKTIHVKKSRHFAAHSVVAARAGCGAYLLISTVYTIKGKEITATPASKKLHITWKYNIKCGLLYKSII